MGKKNKDTRKNEAKKPTGNKDRRVSMVSQNEKDIQKEAIKEAILLALREFEKEKALPQNDDATSQRQGFWSTLGIIMCMPFARRKTIKGSETMGLVAKMVLSIIFEMLRWLTLALSVVSIGTIVYEVRHNSFGDIIVEIIALIALAAVSYMFSGVFRRVSVEVENVKDENILLAFFAAVGTWISIIVALIAICK